MDKDLVTETPFELFDKAESDVLIIFIFYSAGDL